MSSFFLKQRALRLLEKLRVQSFSTSSLAEGRESISKPAGCLARLWDLAPPVWGVASSFVSEDFQGCHTMAQQEAERGEQHVFCFLVPFRPHSCFNKEVQFALRTTTPPSGAYSPTGVVCLANCCNVFCSQSDGLEQKCVFVLLLLVYDWLFLGLCLSHRTQEHTVLSVKEQQRISCMAKVCSQGRKAAVHMWEWHT